jgi:membrane protein implicated in regulation of membrane protease activity
VSVFGDIVSSLEARQRVQIYDPRVATDHELIGKTGRVTGAIEAGRLGEVMVPVRGGTEAFYAYAVDPAEAIPKGTRIVVVEHEPPRTVVVSRLA